MNEKFLNELFSNSCGSEIIDGINTVVVDLHCARFEVTIKHIGEGFDTTYEILSWTSEDA